MAGAAIILRPGIQAIGWGPPLILFSAMMWAVSLIFIKALSRTDSSLTIATYMVIVTTPFSLLAALPVWQWPGGEQLFWMLLVGLLGSAGQICLAQAFKMAEASSVLPFDFLQLIWAALLGFLVFGEVPDRWVWVGGTLIFLSSTYPGPQGIGKLGGLRPLTIGGGLDWRWPVSGLVSEWEPFTGWNNLPNEVERQ